MIYRARQCISRRLRPRFRQRPHKMRFSSTYRTFSIVAEADDTIGTTLPEGSIGDALPSYFYQSERFPQAPASSASCALGLISFSIINVSRFLIMRFPEMQRQPQKMRWL